jgi:hypothetical protein
MNDFLRLLRTLLRRHGYDIKRYYEYNLLPVKHQEDINQLARLSEAVAQDHHPDNGEEFDLNRLHICLRTCLRDQQKGENKPTNPTGADRGEVVLRCMNSLISSINHAIQCEHGMEITLTVFDDHSDTEYRTKIADLCRLVNCVSEMRTTQENGQGASLIEQFEFARGKHGLFYFCEDDYLHDETALAEMYRFYTQIYRICGTHLVIHPQEHEFLYIKAIYPSYLLLGDHRHWRTISHATHVLFTHSDVVRKYWQYFENTRHVGDVKKRRLGSEAKTTNLLFDHIPGFAPIPALAAHIQTENCLPPFFDWRALWDKNSLD